MVKPIPLADVALKGEKDPFSTLIPFEILQSVSIYNVMHLIFLVFITMCQNSISFLMVSSQEKKAALIREELRKIRDHNDMAKG